jgi:hypothetical protein
MFLDTGPEWELDHDKFAESLDPAQVGFLIIALKGSTNKRYYPLREALERRLAHSPIKSGVGQLVFRQFYRRVGSETNGGNKRT